MTAPLRPTDPPDSSSSPSGSSAADPSSVGPSSVESPDTVRRQVAEIDQQLLGLLARRRAAVQAGLSAGQEPLVGAMAAANQAIDEVLATAAGPNAPAEATEATEATGSTGSTGATGSTAGRVEPPALSRAQLRAWLRHAASLSLAGEHNNRVAFLGPKFSYSYLATTNYFGDAAELAPVQSIEAVFESVLAEDCRAGVVPIENSTDGRIVDTLGMFVKHRVAICGEVLLPIHHTLLSRSPLEAIAQVCSKPQALSQCRHWLSRHLPEARTVAVASTTEAARIASEQPGVAAVAARQAGQPYGLDVVAANIEDNPHNVTRFAVLGKEAVAATGRDKTTLLLQVAHKPGALADAMAIFKNNRLNLTWIESFPISGERAEYFFFVECEGHQSDPAVQAAIEALRSQALRLDILGSYPQAQPA